MCKFADAIPRGMLYSNSPRPQKMMKTQIIWTWMACRFHPQGRRHHKHRHLNSLSAHLSSRIQMVSPLLRPRVLQKGWEMDSVGICPPLIASAQAMPKVWLSTFTRELQLCHTATCRTLSELTFSLASSGPLSRISPFCHEPQTKDP